MKYKLSLGIRIKGFSYEESFAIAKETGFDAVDFGPQTKHLFTDASAIKALSEKYKIPVTSIHQPLYLIPFAPQFLFRRMLAIANHFPDAKHYILHLSGFFNHFQSNQKKIDVFTRLAKKRGISIAFESNPVFLFLTAYPKVTWHADKFGEYCQENNVPIVFDTSHIASVGGDVVEFYEKYHKHIRVLHLSDFKNGVEHLPLGEGALPIKKLLQVIRSKQQKLHIIFEINTFPSTATKKEKIAAIQKSFTFAQKIVA